MFSLSRDQDYKGINQITTALCKWYCLPIMIESSITFINNCEKCILNKYRNLLDIKFNLTPTTSKPFEHIYFNFFKRDYWKLSNHYWYLFSIWINLALEKLHITPYRGTELINKGLENYCQLYSIELHYITSKLTNSNLPAERFRSTLIVHFRCLNSDNKILSPDLLMKRAIIGYNIQYIRWSYTYKNLHQRHGPIRSKRAHNHFRICTKSQRNNCKALPFPERPKPTNKRKDNFKTMLK